MIDQIIMQLYRAWSESSIDAQMSAIAESMTGWHGESTTTTTTTTTTSTDVQPLLSKYLARMLLHYSADRRTLLASDSSALSMHADQLRAFASTPAPTSSATAATTTGSSTTAAAPTIGAGLTATSTTSSLFDTAATSVTDTTTDERALNSVAAAQQRRLSKLWRESLVSALATLLLPLSPSSSAGATQPRWFHVIHSKLSVHFETVHSNQSTTDVQAIVQRYHFYFIFIQLFVAYVCLFLSPFVI